MLNLQFSSCKKEFLHVPKEAQPKLAASQVNLTIDLKDIYAKLPKTIMYNLGQNDKANLYLNRAQWQYTSDGLLARIPTSASKYNFIYAYKSYADPGTLNVYAVKFTPDENSTDDNFSGKQVWIDFQSWKAYGIRYQKNVAVSYMNPQVLAEPDWEQRAMAYGHFYVSAGNVMEVIGDCNDAHGDGSGHLVTMDGDIPCPNDVNGNGKSWLGNLFSGVGDFFSNVGRWVGGIFGNGDDDDDHGVGDGEWGSDYGGGGYGGGGWPGGGGGGGTTGPGGPNPPFVLDGINLGSGPAIINLYNSNVAWLVSILGLTVDQGLWFMNHTDQADKVRNFLLTFLWDLTADEKYDVARDHIKMMMEDPNYLTRINNLPGHWWDRDQDGFIEARKIHMGLYLQANPYGMIDCNDINQLPMNMLQEVGSYPVPQSVVDRINTIRGLYPSIFNISNFKIQPIQGAYGPVVNCDYFGVHIAQLPYNSNNVRMTPDEFLENFRSGMTFYVSLGGSGTTFEAYIQSPFSDASKFISPYENSIGSIIQISIPPVFDNGTVVESGYLRNSALNEHWFMFTTMTSPLDGEHPVAGNRRFGIFPDPNGGYCFYTMGVDRTNDLSTTTLNTFFNAAFNGADNLWHSMQDGVISHVNSLGSGGSANLYSPREVIARPKWEGVVKKFLQGQITLQQLKTALHCP